MGAITSGPIDRGVDVDAGEVDAHHARAATVVTRIVCPQEETEFGVRRYTIEAAAEKRNPVAYEQKKT